jgi:NADP-dependent 3-hydroxy acid dehydrogenase YdfG
VVITGATSGIGRALAFEVAQRGLYIESFVTGVTDSLKQEPMWSWLVETLLQPRRYARK